MPKIKKIQEFSLSRLWQHNKYHDCGAITAFRRYSDCDGTSRHIYSKKENLQRNKSLGAKLGSKEYGLIKLHGIYPEGGKNIKETSYFVVDLFDAGKLERNLKILGEFFDQDSILFIPKGAISNDIKAYLVGTNKCTNNWIGYGKKKIFSKGKLGYSSSIYTSFVNGRPFLFESIGEYIGMPGTGFGVWAMRSIAKDKWRNIEV